MALSKHMQSAPTQQPQPDQLRLADQAPSQPAPATDDAVIRELQRQFPGSRLVTDPRPELGQDSLLWTCLLAESSQDEELFSDLFYIRKIGTRIMDVNGGLKLQPIIDPLNDIGWPSLDEYREVTNECLRPRAGQLIALLERASRLSATLSKAS